MSTGATLGCCDTHAALIREWLSSGHSLTNRWVAQIRRYCRKHCTIA